MVLADMANPPEHDFAPAWLKIPTHQQQSSRPQLVNHGGRGNRPGPADEHQDRYKSRHYSTDSQHGYDRSPNHDQFGFRGRDENRHYSSAGNRHHSVDSLPWDPDPTAQWNLSQFNGNASGTYAASVYPRRGSSVPRNGQQQYSSNGRFDGSGFASGRGQYQQAKPAGTGRQRYNSGPKSGFSEREDHSGDTPTKEEGQGEGTDDAGKESDNNSALSNQDFPSLSATGHDVETSATVKKSIPSGAWEKPPGTNTKVISGRKLQLIKKSIPSASESKSAPRAAAPSSAADAPAGSKVVGQNGSTGSSSVVLKSMTSVTPVPMVSSWSKDSAIRSAPLPSSRMSPVPSKLSPVPVPNRPAPSDINASPANKVPGNLPSPQKSLIGKVPATLASRTSAGSPSSASQDAAQVILDVGKAAGCAEASSPRVTPAGVVSEAVLTDAGEQTAPKPVSDAAASVTNTKPTPTAKASSTVSPSKSPVSKSLTQSSSNPSSVTSMSSPLSPAKPASVTNISTLSPFKPTSITNISTLSPAKPTSITNISTLSPAKPASVTNISTLSPFKPTSITNISTLSPAKPTSITNISTLSPGKPTSIANISTLSPAKPTSITNISTLSPAKPASVTNKSTLNPAKPTSITNISTLSPAKPTNITNISTLSPAKPTSITTMSTLNPAKPTSVTQMGSTLNSKPNPAAARPAVPVNRPAPAGGRSAPAFGRPTPLSSTRPPVTIINRQIPAPTGTSDTVPVSLRSAPAGSLHSKKEKSVVHTSSMKLLTKEPPSTLPSPAELPCPSPATSKPKKGDKLVFLNKLRRSSNGDLSREVSQNNEENLLENEANVTMNGRTTQQKTIMKREQPDIQTNGIDIHTHFTTFEKGSAEEIGFPNFYPVFSPVKDVPDMSSSLEAEKRLLQEMGWHEHSDNEEGYAPLTEDELKEFQKRSQQMKKNGLTRALPVTWNSVSLPLGSMAQVSLDDGFTSSDSDSSDDEQC